MTGLLVFSGGRFMQLIEGADRTILDLYANIRKDPRHHRVMRLIYEPAADRLFADWAMALMNLDVPCELDVNGLREIVEAGATLDGGRTALGLLREFAGRIQMGPTNDGVLIK